MLGFAASGLSIDMKMALSEQFDSVSAMTSAVDSYFEAYYTPDEQAAAKPAQFAKVFDSLDLAMPSTLYSFRALVDAQYLTTASTAERRGGKEGISTCKLRGVRCNKKKK